ncbi:MAG: hypothetical protein ACRDPY_28305 [Streptosporangiaceae bacterium]
MASECFTDPVLELTRRCGGDVGNFDDVLEFAGDMTSAEAATVLEVLDELEAEERAAGLAGDLRRAGLLW